MGRRCLADFAAGHFSFVQRGGGVRFKSEIMDEAAVLRALRRMSFEVLERNKGCEDICFVGICRRGVPLAELMAENIYKTEGVTVPTGQLDIALYRDDIQKDAHTDPIIHTAELGFSIEGKRVVLVDDVLYTGRTVRAAMDALIAIGRPASIQLAILCDRGHRELPIRADYIGKNIPTAKNERVVVKLPPFDEEIRVELQETDN